jgi:hypothetical protein
MEEQSCLAVFQPTTGGTEMDIPINERIQNMARSPPRYPQAGK